MKNIINEFQQEEFGVLAEKLITFAGQAYPKFGNVVIMAGGAGSGKGFILKRLIGAEGFTFDVDELKTIASKTPAIAKRIKEELGVDMADLSKNLKDPANVSKLHEIIGGYLGLDNKKLNTLYKSIISSDADRKPNLIFDVTLKDMKKFQNLVEQVKLMGYDSKKIHIVWVVNDIEIAKAQNAKRSRSVPVDILVNTHMGASSTMNDLLKMGNDIKKYIDGDIIIAFNKVGIDSEVVGSGKGGSYVKAANYVYMKRSGKPIMTLDEVDADIKRKIAEYVPKGVVWESMNLEEARSMSFGAGDDKIEVGYEEMIATIWSSRKSGNYGTYKAIANGAEIILKNGEKYIVTVMNDGSYSVADSSGKMAVGPNVEDAAYNLVKNGGKKTIPVKAVEIEFKVKSKGGFIPIKGWALQNAKGDFYSTDGKIPYLPRGGKKSAKEVEKTGVFADAKFINPDLMESTEFDINDILSETSLNRNHWAKALQDAEKQAAYNAWEIKNTGFTEGVNSDTHENYHLIEELDAILLQLDNVINEDVLDRIGSMIDKIADTGSDLMHKLKVDKAFDAASDFLYKIKADKAFDALGSGADSVLYAVGDIIRDIEMYREIKRQKKYYSADDDYSGNSKMYDTEEKIKNKLKSLKTVMLKNLKKK